MQLYAACGMPGGVSHEWAWPHGTALSETAHSLSIHSFCTMRRRSINLCITFIFLPLRLPLSLPLYLSPSLPSPFHLQLFSICIRNLILGSGLTGDLPALFHIPFHCICYSIPFNFNFVSFHFVYTFSFVTELFIFIVFHKFNCLRFIALDFTLFWLFFVSLRFYIQYLIYFICCHSTLFRVKSDLMVFWLIGFGLQ